MEINGFVDKDGKLQLYRRKELADWIGSRKGKSVVLKIDVQRKKRSNDQNEYMWKVVIPMIQEALFELGNDFSKEDVHEMLKAKFNAVEVVNRQGVSDFIPQSTTKLTTTEFMAYIARIQQWAAQFLSIVIPDPNQQTELYSVLIASHHPSTKVTVINKAS